MLNDKPKACYESGCPMAEVGRGFVLGAGDPTKAKYMFILEAPGAQEVSFQLRPAPGRQFLATAEEVEREVAVRRRDYPEMEEKYLRTGLPIVGPTGSALASWVLPKVGIRREDIYLDNTIRCLAPKSKGGGQYPTGEARKGAEKFCRQYDRLDKFRPTVLVTTIHPASILREITPLPLLVKDVEKVRDFTTAGQKVGLLLGGKAAKAFLRYGENSTRWRGTYEVLPPDWLTTYLLRFDYKAKGKNRKKMDEEDFFSVAPSVRRLAREKVTRPEECKPGACKSAKRHTHKRPPRCGFDACWTKFEEVQD